MSNNIGCTKEENSKNENKLAEKLKTLESTLVNRSLTNKGSYTREELISVNNNYDYAGQKLLISIDTLSAFIASQQQIPNTTLEDDILPFVEIQISALETDSLVYNAEEEILLKSFTKNITLDNAIETAKIYEQFVYENYSDQADVKNFLISVSTMKYHAYATISGTGGGFSVWEACVISCMNDEFSSYNGVDWFQFVLGNPGRAVLWAWASCGWDCY